MKLLRLLPLLLCGCAAWHDLFYRDHPDERLIEEVLAVPGPEVADAALILGCPAGPGGALSPCQACRVHAAVRSYQQGRVRYLLFSGGAAHNRFVEADVMARAAVARGVPEERIIREGLALTTWQNLRFSQRLLRAHGLRTALIISTADHLPRARRFTEYYGIPATYLACDRKMVD
jgi:uncharacterized SAM-binding protein YcdF (DUF218 family)